MGIESGRPSIDPSTERTGPKERKIGDHELGNYLAAVGNSELKALLLTSMEPGQVHTARNLLRIMMAPQHEGRGRHVWTMNHGALFNLCALSFEPIGLVAREVVDPARGVYGYLRTEDKGEKATALAGHLLDFSERHPDVTLQGLLGATQTVAKATVEKDQDEQDIDFRLRAQLTRYRIFSLLLGAHLPLSTQDLQYILRDAYPDDYGGNSNRAKFGARIRAHIDELSRSGIIEVTAAATARAGQGGSIQHINLESSKRAMLEEFVAIVDNFASGDEAFLAAGDRKAKAIVDPLTGDSQSFCNLLEKFRKGSNYANSMDRETSTELIASFIRQNPNITARDLDEILRENGYTQWGLKSLNLLLVDLEKSGVISSTPGKGSKPKRYTIIEEQES